MKRILLIVLWPVAFWVVTMIVGMFGFGLLGLAGVESWDASWLLAIGFTWSWIFIGMPILGLVLALLGKLPGTRKVKKGLEDAAYR